MAKFRMSEEEFERQHEEAVRRGEERMRTEPQAESAAYDRATGRLVIELKNGCTFIVPTELMQGLRGADPELIAEVKLLPRGAALHWEKLDVDFSLAALLAGLFGSERWMAEVVRGGKRAPAKAQAATKNGKKESRARVGERKKVVG